MSKPTLEDMIRAIVRDEIAKAQAERHSGLRTRRVRAGMSVRELSERAGINVATICSLENGRTKNPRKHVVKRLNEVFGTSEWLTLK